MKLADGVKTGASRGTVGGELVLPGGGRIGRCHGVKLADGVNGGVATKAAVLVEEVVMVGMVVPVLPAGRGHTRGVKASRRTGAVGGVMMVPPPAGRGHTREGVKANWVVTKVKVLLLVVDPGG